MPLDPPFDNRFALHATDPESIRHWANRLPGIGKWVELKSIGFTSPWADLDAGFAPSRIRREFADIVRVEGILKTTSSIYLASNIIRLPPAYRPVNANNFPQEGRFTGGTETVGRVQVAETGIVSLRFLTGTTPDSVSFITFNFTYTLSANK